MILPLNKEVGLINDVLFIGSIVTLIFVHELFVWFAFYKQGNVKL
jgi:hypothetical protein